MKYYCLFLGSLLLTMVFLKAESLDAILPSSVRQGVIEEAEYYSQYPRRLEVLDCSQVHFKFSAKDTPAPVISEKPILDVENLTPESILVQAAALLNPRGVMMRQGIHYLVLPKKPVPAGTKLKISLDTTSYIIVLSEVYSKSYTLEYQNMKKTFVFNPSLRPSSSEKALKK